MAPLQFWKPGTAGPGSSLDRESEAEGSLLLSLPPPTDSNSQHSSRYIAPPSLTTQRTRLPIYKHREKLLWCVEKYGVMIVVGQTGCGKSTQLPQYLHEAGWAAENRVIACTQPRRVAATSVAARVAEEMGSVLGDEVGYSIRFEDLSSPERTRVKYLTDGMLFRETMVDPLLSRYSIDEAHERGAYTDLLLGLLKKIRKKRPELRIIISSATIDASQDDAIIVSLEGRMYPVETAYLDQPVSNYVEAAVQTVFDIHMKEPKGDILVFLTGREEIEEAAQEIADRAISLPKAAPRILPIPLHGGLSPEEQQAMFAPAPRDTRKVIVATNIAEASVTIEGIKYVVDSGFVKLRTYNPKTGMDVLSVTPCSVASANQRAGRAGRTSAGKCFRLYPSSVMRNGVMPITTPPELVRSDISLYLLQLKALGIDNLVRFDFLSPPPTEMMIRALEFLYSLKALDEEGRLTRPLGMNMAEVPVDPMMAAILLNSEEFQCGEEILTIAAMTSVQNVFILGDGAAGAMGEIERRKFTAEEGSPKWCGNHRLNHKALLRAVSIRQQLKKYLDRFGIKTVSCQGDSKRLRRCLVTGYFKVLVIEEVAALFAGLVTELLAILNRMQHV
ncbi:hypothetical protein QFC22_002186 [Naganishia vaughanmartiniae]|uniref:Uncharacterized protein n=1 Tax=Naganishia vaughanmartiniae TaxID=1424756 RepID=A0ACC2XCB7_9TREE|nr:hypothetical protein QFC22_002186 [Naganishia vaughanmartiniae]